MKYWDRSAPHADPNDARFKAMEEVECEVLRLQNFGVAPTWDILCLGQTKKRGAQQRNQVTREAWRARLEGEVDQGCRREMSTDMGVRSNWTSINSLINEGCDELIY